MSNKTSFLGLSLLDTSSEKTTNFKAWSRGINFHQEGEKNDFEIIDEFAQHIYGKSGTLILVTSSWDLDNKKYECTIEDFGDKDALFLTPTTSADKVLLQQTEIFVEQDGDKIVFTAVEVPTQNISMNYFISRGN